MKLTTAIDAVLGDIDFELLTKRKQPEHVAIMEQALGDVWSLTPTALRRRGLAQGGLAPVRGARPGAQAARSVVVCPPQWMDHDG